MWHINYIDDGVVFGFPLLEFGSSPNQILGPPLYVESEIEFLSIVLL